MSRALRIKSAAPSNPNLHANTSCMFQHGAFAVVKDTLSSVSFKAMRLPADLSATLALYHPGSYAAVSLFDVGSSSPHWMLVCAVSTCLTCGSYRDTTYTAIIRVAYVFAVELRLPQPLVDNVMYVATPHGSRCP